MSHRTVVVGRLIVAGCRQGEGAPVIDSAMTTCEEQGWRAGSVVIRLSRRRGPALAIGVKGARPWPPLAVLRERHPLVATMFRPLLASRRGR
jgi:hypothetical protein